MSLRDWIDDLRAALADEYGDRPHVGVLATVDRDGRPHGRSVVGRRVEGGGDVWIATDMRSYKNGHVRHTPMAELVFWLPSRREQFRIGGHVSVVCSTDDDPRRLDLWRSLSDATRAMFFWPPPGRPLDPDAGAFPEAAPADAEPPADFELLIVHPDTVDHLDLGPTPHRRRRWQAGSDWAEEVLNP
jgi:PPOX class probable FMN-dependent enzyme